MAPSKRQGEASCAGGDFVTTRWSVVLSAGRRSAAESRRALADLCGNYWFPLYAFVRRTGYSHEDAQDLTQEFFARLLDKNYLAVADAQRGRFRWFLLGAMRHFLANQRRRAKAQKRGGGRAPLSLDFEAAETHYCLEPPDPLTPERLYEKRWALALLEQVLKRLRDEFTAAGKESLFDHLKQFLAGRQGADGYHQTAGALGMSEGAVKVAVHRLRRRYRELLEQEIAQTVASPEEIEDELRELLAAVRSDPR